MGQVAAGEAGPSRVGPGGGVTGPNPNPGPNPHSLTLTLTPTPTPTLTLTQVESLAAELCNEGVQEACEVLSRVTLTLILTLTLKP